MTCTSATCIEAFRLLVPRKVLQLILAGSNQTTPRLPLIPYNVSRVTNAIGLLFANGYFHPIYYYRHTMFTMKRIDLRIPLLLSYYHYYPSHFAVPQ